MTSSSFRCESAVSHQCRRPTSMLLPFKSHSEGKTRVLSRQGHTPQNRGPLIHLQHRWLCKGCTDIRKKCQRRDRSQAPCGRCIGAQDSWNSKVGQYRTPCSTELWTCRMQGATSLPQVPWLQLRPPSWPFVAQDQHLPASLAHMQLLVLPQVSQALFSPRRQVALRVSFPMLSACSPKQYCLVCPSSLGVMGVWY